MVKAPVIDWIPLTKESIFKRKELRTYKEWSRKFIARETEYRKKCDAEYFKYIQGLNYVHKGPKYIKNTPGYIIEVKDLNKWFTNRISRKIVHVLHDVTLKIREGEFIVIVGYSGSGKSTLLNVLSGLERPSCGRIVVAGHNLIAQSKRELTLFRKENLSFIFQNYALIPELTARENIMQGAALQENVYRRLDINELSEFIGVTEHLDKHVNQLSGGQQQRVAIVKSIIKNPKILFADEPTAAVDEETAKNILKIFKDINERYGTTVVLITHNPIISMVANRLIHVKHGRIVKCVHQRPVAIDDLPWVSISNG